MHKGSFFRSWTAHVRVGFRRTTAYPLDVIGHIGTLASYFLIFRLVNGGSFADGEPVVAYWLLMAVFFSVLTFSSLGIFTDDIRTGRIFLLEMMPASHVHRLSGIHVGQKLPNLIIGFALVLITGQGAFFWGPGIFLITVYITLAFAIVLCIELCIGIFAFSVPFFIGIGELKSKVFLFFSGLILNPENLPWGLDILAYCTPIPWLVHEPVSAAIEGRLDLQVVLMQCLWLGVFGVLYFWLERGVTSRSEGFGG